MGIFAQRDSNHIDRFFLKLKKKTCKILHVLHFKTCCNFIRIFPSKFCFLIHNITFVQLFKNLHNFFFRDCSNFKHARNMQDMQEHARKTGNMQETCKKKTTLLQQWLLCLLSYCHRQVTNMQYAATVSSNNNIITKNSEI